VAALKELDGSGGPPDFGVPFDPDPIEIDQQAARLKKMKSGVLTSARLISSELESPGSFRYRTWFITLTNAPGNGWDPRAVSDCIRHYRHWAKKQGFTLRYTWVAEIQENRYLRGGSTLEECVHYHLLVWVPARLTPPKPDKQGWWLHGSTQRIQVRRPVKYMMKYASKGGTIPFPKGLRIHGCGGLSESSKDERRWWLMPKWVRSIFSIKDRPFRAKGGGIVSRETGDWYPSIYEVFLAGGRVFCKIKHNLLDSFSALQVSRFIELGII
jgi:hypothetical protein